MRQRMCKVCGNWHDLDEPWPVKCIRHVSRDAAPHVISDNMDPLKHHATGEIMTSKRAFARTTRAMGCVELGNEPIQARKPIPLDKRQRREDIKRTIYQLRNGYQ